MVGVAQCLYDPYRQWIISNKQGFSADSVKVTSEGLIRVHTFLPSKALDTREIRWTQSRSVSCCFYMTCLYQRQVLTSKPWVLNVTAPNKFLERNCYVVYQAPVYSQVLVQWLNSIWPPHPPLALQLYTFRTGGGVRVGAMGFVYNHLLSMTASYHLRIWISYCGWTTFCTH